MSHVNFLEHVYLMVRAVIWLFVLLSVNPQVSVAKNMPAPDFPHDIGLSPAFITVHISRLRTSSGLSHYRMRYYEFELDKLAHQKIADLFAKQRLQSWTSANPARSMIDTLVRIGRPNETNAWVWTDLFPPYQQRFIACYRGADPDYGFRWLEIQPRRAGKRRALLAAGNRVPVLNGAVFSDGEGIKLTQTAEFYSPLSTAGPLPYPFARRSFQEMLRTKFEPQSLNYFGFIFVDAKHWFRFSASKIEI